MVTGIGIDLIETLRVAEKIAKDSGFREYVFSENEIAYCESKTNQFEHFAARFAAKEAIVKAMGTGFAHGMWIRDAGVVSNAWGKPEIVWSDRGRVMCEKLGIGDGHVTLTDEAGLIVAVAVLMRKG